MALTDDGGNGMVMPVQPMGGNGYGYGYPMMAGFPMMGGYGYGGGLLGGGGDWIVLFLLAAMFGGFGGGWGMNGMNGGGMFPWLLNGQQGINTNTNAGFDHAATQSAIASLQGAVTSGFGDTQLGLASVNQNICQTGNNITQAVNNGFAQAEIANGARNGALVQQLYNNEIASLNRSFAEQTANSQGFNSLQGQLAQCCCDNRLATVQTQNMVKTEAAATRAANVAGNQAILDKLCQLELDNAKAQIDAKNDTIAQLRQEVLYARGQASQDVQTARILAGQAQEVDSLYNRLNNCPVGTVPVYGRQPIFNCNNGGCGCGSGFTA